MTLREWLFKQRLSITYFAYILKVDRTYVYRWMKGEKVPSQKIMDKIRKITLDQVSNFEDLKDGQPNRTLSKEEIQE